MSNVWQQAARFAVSILSTGEANDRPYHPFYKHVSGLQTAMIEPVALKDFFITFFSSALIILAGAAYALLFAWSKANSNIRIKLAAYSAYLVLAASVAELSYTAHFSGYWLIISAAMLIGYFFAPIGIWHLCVKTHADHDLTTTTEEDKL